MAVAPSVPIRDIVDRLNKQTHRVCPHSCLCHDPSRLDVGRMVNEYVTDPYNEGRHAVYVLECKHRSLGKASTIALDVIQSDRTDAPYWVRNGAKAQQRVYVGVSKRVRDRIYNHAQGTGGRFPQVFPPLRILDISWYHLTGTSYDAEAEVAERIDAATRDDVYVFQR